MVHGRLIGSVRALKVMLLLSGVGSRHTQKKILRRAHDAASARTMAWLSGVKFIFPGTAFATRERRFCVIPRYRFRYWEPGAFSVPGRAVFCRSPWYRFRYYFLYFQVKGSGGSMPSSG